MKTILDLIFGLIKFGFFLGVFIMLIVLILFLQESDIYEKIE